MNTELTEKFETKTCGRCGGSGHYSYCQMYGTICFECKGRKNVYTRRAEAALAYARELRTVPASDIQVGWLLWIGADPMGSHKAGWYAVESISTDGSRYCSKGIDGVETWHPYTYLNTRVCSQGICADGTVQAVPNRERLAEIKTLALQYQATLNERGKQLKRAAKAAQLQALSA